MILTGMRISMGIAWLVIVAAEMLVGNLGIGYFVWNEWNNLSLSNVIFAILMIGVVGMVLDLALRRAAARGRLRRNERRHPSCRCAGSRRPSRRRATPVFDDVSFSIERGEFVCVIGHSGCGKTTILNILAGLDQRDAPAR